MFSPGPYLRNFHTGIHRIRDGRLQYTGWFEALLYTASLILDTDLGSYEL